MKNTFLLLILPLTVLSSGGLSAQSASFTDAASDARSLSMGNSGYASAGNAFSVMRNMSALPFGDADFAAGYSFTLLAPGSGTYTGMHSAGGYYNLAGGHSLGAGFRFMGYKKIEIETPDISFRPSDLAVDLGYAYRLATRFSLGATLRYIRSEQGSKELAPEYKTGNAFAGDLAAMYSHNGLSASAGVYNIGSKINYGAGGNSLSTHIKAGVAYEWNFSQKHFLTGELDLSQLVTADEGAHSTFTGIGAEYSYAKKYSFRAGYRIADRYASYATLGAGVVLGPVSLDLAYVLAGRDVMMRNTLLVGASFAM